MLVLATAVFADEPTPPAAVWARFRGPNGSGTSGDKNIPLKFGTSENMIWQVELPGVGNSSPIVWGDRIFVHAASADGKERSLLCLDAADGKIRWRKTVPAEFAKIRSDSSMASSTPTTDGKAVYVSFWNGKDIILTAYDFQGESLWSKNLGVFNSQHGAGASPIIYKDKVILANDMDKDDFTTKVPNPNPSTLLALDKRTGALVWEAARAAERTCYSAPFLIERAGRKEAELVITSTTAVTGYDVATGTKLWEAKGWQGGVVKTPMRTVASPALVGNVLCVCAGGDGGRFAIGLALPATSDEKTPKKAWENRKDFPYVPSPLAHGEHVYFVTDAGFAGCFRGDTGAKVWHERIPGAAFNSSPLLIDGHVYAISTTGDVYVFAAEPKFHMLSQNELGETIRATPAVAGGRLYIRGEKHLFCVGKR